LTSGDGSIFRAAALPDIRMDVLKLLYWAAILSLNRAKAIRLFLLRVGYVQRKIKISDP
jgi:hypothetical protein